MLKDSFDKPYTSLDSYEVVKYAPSAFLGATTNARGDTAGTGNPLTLFTVTGDVIVRLYGVCTTALTGATGTVAVGVTGNTALLLPVSTGTDFAANDVWVDATPGEVGGVALSTVPGPFLITNGSDIIETVATADITAGNIYYICLWRKISENGHVDAAV